MIIYRTCSFIQLTLIFLINLGYLIGAALAIYHFHENPIATVTVASILLFFFFVSDVDEIIVYSDVISYKSKGLIKCFNKAIRFKIDDIKSINAVGDFSTGNEVYVPKITKGRELNKVYVHLRNGRKSVFVTNIYIEKLNHAIAEINKIIAYRN